MSESDGSPDSAEALAGYLRGVADKLDSGTYCNHDAWMELTHRSPYADDLEEI